METREKQGNGICKSLEMDECMTLWEEVLTKLDLLVAMGGAGDSSSSGCFSGLFAKPILTMSSLQLQLLAELVLTYHRVQ